MKPTKIENVYNIIKEKEKKILIKIIIIIWKNLTDT